MFGRKIQVPVLFLNSKRYLGYGCLFTDLSSSDSYSLSVRYSDHYNFSDYSAYPVPAVESLLGSIDANKVIEIMNVTVLAFFEKYLEKRQEIDISELAEKYSGIEIVINLKTNLNYLRIRAEFGSFLWNIIEGL
jgi:hypothetical protein